MDYKMCCNCQFWMPNPETQTMICAGGLYGQRTKPISSCSSWKISFDEFCTLLDKLEKDNNELYAKCMIFDELDVNEVVENLLKEKIERLDQGGGLAPAQGEQ